jgi:Mn2+/Fe2+ NRAMP family transporter
MSGTTITHMTLMSSTILVAIAAIVIALLKKKNFFKIHRYVTLSGVGLGLIGVVVMFVSKSMKGFEHFTSDHSRAGLAGFLLLAGASIGGLMAAKFGKKGKIAHRVFGALALLTALSALAGGIARL